MLTSTVKRLAPSHFSNYRGHLPADTVGPAPLPDQLPFEPLGLLVEAPRCLHDPPLPVPDLDRHTPHPTLAQRPERGLAIGGPIPIVRDAVAQGPPLADELAGVPELLQGPCHVDVAHLLVRFAEHPPARLETGGWEGHMRDALLPYEIPAPELDVAHHRADGPSLHVVVLVEVVAGQYVLGQTGGQFEIQVGLAAEPVHRLGPECFGVHAIEHVAAVDEG